MFSPEKRACGILPLVSRIPTQPDIEMGTVSLLVPEDAMEVDFDAGVEPALVRRGAKRVSAMWEERADQTSCNLDAVETLSWYATVGKIGGVTSTKSHLCRQSLARPRPTKPREMRPS